VRELTPIALVFGRTAIAAVLLLPIAALRGELRLARRHWVPLLAFTGIEIMLPWLFLAHAEIRLTSSLTGLLIAAVPLVGAVVTTLTGERERHGARRWAGLLIGIAGVAAIVGLDVRGAGVGGRCSRSRSSSCRTPSDRSSWPAGSAMRRRSAWVAASLALPPWATHRSRRSRSRPHYRLEGERLGAHARGRLHGACLRPLLQLIAETGPVRATVITYVNPGRSPQCSA